MNEPDSGAEQRPAEMQRQIEDLEAQVAVDRAVIADLRAEGVIERDKIVNLETALIAARRIGAAMGILMASHQVTEEQAFALLRAASQRQNRKLRDVADDVILTGTIA